MNIGRRNVLTAGLAATVAGGARAQTQELERGSAPALTPEELQLRTDWADLAHYRDDNARVAGLPAAQRRVVFMGDSITRSWLDFDPAFFTSNGFVDRGISGQTTPQMLVRFRQDAIALQPTAVHLLGGTNDVAENTGPFDAEATKNNLLSMVELARMHRIRIVLAALPPAAAIPWRAVSDAAGKIRRLNEWIRAYAGLNGFAFADYTAVLDDGTGAMKPGLAPDGVHPNKAGYLAMAPIAQAAIAQALA